MSRPNKSTRKNVQAQSPTPAGPGAWLACVVVIGGLIAYASSFGGVFLFDDVPHIVENSHIRSLADLGDILATRRPVVTLSLAINYALGGLNPWGYHLFNMVVHILAGMTLFAVVRRTLLTDRLRESYGPASAWIAAIAALLWTVHPLQTESVTYVIQRGESLMGLFYLLTLYCLMRGVSASPQLNLAPAAKRRDRSERASVGSPAIWYAAAILCCALGMGSKAVMITAPIVVLLFDRIFLAATIAEIVRRRWWLYAGLAATWLVLVACGVTRGVLQSEGAATVGFGVRDVTPEQYALTQPEVIRHYLKLCIWPYPLCLDYRWPPVEGLAQAVGSLAGLLALLGATIWALVRKPTLGFVGVWFFAILLPTSSFIPIRDLAFEHRMYLPLASFVLLLVLAVHHALQWLRRQGRLSTPGTRFVAAVLALLSAGGLTFATAARNIDYHDEVAMWSQIIAMRPDHARAYANRAGLLVQRDRYSEAESDCRRAIELDPTLFGAHNSLGLILKSKGQYSESLASYEVALTLASERYKGQVHSNMVLPLLQLGRYADALWHGQQAVAFGANDAEAHNNYGMALWMNGKADEAEGQYREALRLDPNLWQAHHNLGLIHSHRGEHEKAIEEYKTALRARPDYADAHCEWGFALFELSKRNRPELIEQAARKFQDALRYNPGHQRARDALASLQAGTSATKTAPNGMSP